MRRRAGQRRVGALLLVGAVLALLAGVGPAGAVPAGRTAQGDVPVVGAGSSGEIAFELTGRIERRESSITLYGYFTYIAGLAPDEIFTDPTRHLAETARFTLFGTAEPQPLVTLDQLAVATAIGEVSVYYNPRARASFEAPESFFSGTQVAAGTARFQDILIGDPAAARYVDLSVTLTFTEHAPVELENGDEISFAELDVPYRLAGAGEEQPGDEGSNRTTTTFGGRAVIGGGTVFVETEGGAETDPGEEDGDQEGDDDGDDERDDEGDDEEDEEREPPVVLTPTGDDGDEPPAVEVDCAEARTWLTGTLGRLGRARALVTQTLAILDDEDADPLDDLDADDLREIVAELTELATAQEDAESPAETDEIDRQVTAAFEAFAEGLDLLATAVEEGDEETLDEARTLIAAADEGLDAASRPLADLASTCGFRPT